MHYGRRVGNEWVRAHGGRRGQELVRKGLERRVVCCDYDENDLVASHIESLSPNCKGVMKKCILFLCVVESEHAVSQ